MALYESDESAPAAEGGTPEDAMAGRLRAKRRGRPGTYRRPQAQRPQRPRRQRHQGAQAGRGRPVNRGYTATPVQPPAQGPSGQQPYQPQPAPAPAPAPQQTSLPFSPQQNEWIQYVLDSYTGGATTPQDAERVINMWLSGTAYAANAGGQAPPGWRFVNGQFISPDGTPWGGQGQMGGAPIQPPPRQPMQQPYQLGRPMQPGPAAFEPGRPMGGRAQIMYQGQPLRERIQQNFTQYGVPYRPLGPTPR